MEENSMGNGNKRHSILRYKFLFPAFIILLLEVFVFNLPFWDSLSSSSAAKTPNITASAGFQGSAGDYHVTDAKRDYIQVNLQSPQNIKNIHLDATADDHAYGQPRATLFVSPLVRDDGSVDRYVNLGTAHVMRKIHVTQYLRIHPSGNVHSLRLKFPNLKKGDGLHILSLRINVLRPFSFSLLRVSALLFFCYMVMLFLPRSEIYRWCLNLIDHRQKVLLAAFVVIQIAVILVVSQLTFPGRAFAKPYMSPDGAFINDDNQYNHLADAIIAGRPWLGLHVPDWLQNLQNPYDTSVRTHYALVTGEQSYWDYAFFNGRYYSYFGVLPALLTFVPWKILTGHDLRNDAAVVLFAVGFLVTAIYFLYRLYKRFFPNSSFGLFLLSCIFLVNSSGLLTLLYSPKIYSIPILAALTFSLLGLGIWIGARTDDHLSKRSLFLGSLFVAATLACRPQFVLTALLALPLFWQEIKDGWFFGVHGLKNMLCAVSPFLAVGSGVMAYNWIRFGSVADFGVTYNLTGFDVAHRSTSLIRIPWGIWMYLFQPINYGPNYPFILALKPIKGFLGQIIMEPFFGGLFAFVPITLIVFCIYGFRTQLRRRGVFGVSVLALGLAVMTIGMDTILGGLSPRYGADFTWLFLMVSIIMYTTYIEGTEETGKKRMMATSIVMTLIAMGVVLGYMNLFSDGRYSDMSSTNPLIYRYIESWLLFLQ